MRGSGDRRRALGGAAAVRLDADGGAGSSRGGSRAGGRDGERRAGVHLQDPRADPHAPARGPGGLRARGPAPARGRRVPVRGALGEALERYGAEGPEPFYRGELARAISEWVVERGGTLGVEDLASYEPIARYPARGRFRGRDVLTNPPPSSGGILVAFGLDLLDRLGAAGVEEVVAVMEQAQAARTEEFHAGLYEDGWLERFLDPARLDAAAERARSRLRPPGDGVAGPGDRLGSTTHITAVDGAGRCASVTCSNGTGSGPDRPRDRRPRQQHARRGGPEPVRLPHPAGGAADALDDVADGAAPRRGAGGGAGQRRLEPDPLGGPADDRPPGRRGDGRRRGGRGAPRPLRGGRRAGRAGHRPGCPGAPRGARLRDRPLGGAEPVLRRRPRGRRGTPRPASCAEAATRGGAARSRRRETHARRE